MAGNFVLDRESILERLGGDEGIYSMMVDMFLQDVDNNCAAISAAAKAGEAQSLQREAHTIKGLLATFSDDIGAAEAHFVEQKAKCGQMQELAGEVAGLEARLREVAGVLSAAR